MRLDGMSKQERSLLLFFETAAVDNKGRLSGLKMNEDDLNLAKKWKNENFIKFGRMKLHDIEKYKSPSVRTHISHWVILSENAWLLAHEERRARSERMGQYGSK